MCCAPVHMQLCSQGQVLSLSSTLEDARSLPTGGACHCGAHAEVLGAKALLPQPDRLGSSAFKSAYSSVPCIPF